MHVFIACSLPVAVALHNPRKVANLQTRIAELSQKHDELADMKSAYDCDETIDTVTLDCTNPAN